MWARIIERIGLGLGLLSSWSMLRVAAENVQVVAQEAKEVGAIPFSDILARARKQQDDHFRYLTSGLHFDESKVKSCHSILPIDENDKLWRVQISTLLDFFRKTSPRGEGDEDISPDILYDQLALYAYTSTLPWSRGYSFDVLRSYVFPFTAMDEPRHEVGNRFLSEAILKMMREKQFWAKHGPCPSPDTTARWIHGNMMKEAFDKPLKFIPYSTPAIMAPRDTIKKGGASCTGMSILVTLALRSVGFATRIAGTPLWNTPEGGNHSWMEVLLPKNKAERRDHALRKTNDDNSVDAEDDAPENFEWHFCDAFVESEAEAIWDQAWFVPDPVNKQIPWAPLKSVFATTYWSTKEYPMMSWETQWKRDYFPLEWNPPYKGVAGLERTRWYLRKAAEAIGQSPRESSVNIEASND